MAQTVAIHCHWHAAFTECNHCSFT